MIDQDSDGGESSVFAYLRLPVLDNTERADDQSRSRVTEFVAFCGHLIVDRWTRLNERRIVFGSFGRWRRNGRFVSTAVKTGLQETLCSS